MPLFMKYLARRLFERWMRELRISCAFMDLRLDKRGLWVNCWHNGEAPWYIELGSGQYEVSWQRMEYLERVGRVQPSKESDA